MRQASELDSTLTEEVDSLEASIVAELRERQREPTPEEEKTVRGLVAFVFSVFIIVGAANASIVGMPVGTSTASRLTVLIVGVFVGVLTHSFVLYAVPPKGSIELALSSAIGAEILLLPIVVFSIPVVGFLDDIRWGQPTDGPSEKESRSAENQE